MKKVYSSEQWNNAQSAASLLKDNDNFDTVVVVSQTETKNSKTSGFYKFGLSVGDDKEIARYIAQDTLITLARESGNYKEDPDDDTYTVNWNKVSMKCVDGELSLV